MNKPAFAVIVRKGSVKVLGPDEKPRKGYSVLEIRRRPQLKKALILFLFALLPALASAQSIPPLTTCQQINGQAVCTSPGGNMTILTPQTGTTYNAWNSRGQVGTITDTTLREPEKPQPYQSPCFQNMRAMGRC